MPSSRLLRIALLALAVAGAGGQAAAIDSANPHKAAVARAAGPSDDDAARSIRTALSALEARIKELQVETERVRRQSAFDQAALETMRSESRVWIALLGTLLTICVCVIAWLLWRFNAMTKTDARASWAELFADSEMNTAGPTQWQENTELNTAMFNTTAFNAADFHAVASPPPADPKPASGFERAASPADKTAQEKPVAAPADNDAPMPPEPGRPRKADEMATVMELAEAWMALHYPAKVLEVLEPFSKLEQPQSPLPWLCLLDVHRTLGDREKYEAILERIKKIFNVKLAPWTARLDAEQPRTLADFPHVRERILQLWEGDGIVPYLERLLRDDREGARSGFDLPVYRDILRLITLASDPDRPRRDRLERDNACAMLFAPPTRESPPENARNRPPSSESGAEWRHSAFSDENMSPMAIKLHLALAYQDIGDKEGASLLFEEVIHGGNAEQSEQARAMLARLG